MVSARRKERRRYTGGFCRHHGHVHLFEDSEVNGWDDLKQEDALLQRRQMYSYL